MVSIPFSYTIKWPSTYLKKVTQSKKISNDQELIQSDQVNHRVRNRELKMLHRNLDCPEIWTIDKFVSIFYRLKRECL